MKVYLKEKLDDLIDVYSNSVTALASKLMKTKDETYQLLEQAYEKAKKDESIIVDSYGVRFETNFAEITLVQNMKYPLTYPLYLTYRYTANESACDDNCNINENVSVTRNELPKKIDDRLVLIPKNLIILNQYLTGRNELPSEKVIEQLKDAYLVARERNELVPFKDGYNFFTGMVAQSGKPIYAGIKPSEYSTTQEKWILNYIGEGISRFAIDYFAEIPYQRMLSELTVMAREEKWHFGDGEECYEILKNYIAYTFCKLEREGKVCISKDNTFAAINTGLASISYDDIFLCFSRSDIENDERWKYAGVCVAGQGLLGKQLIQCFAPLPQTCSYIMRKEDVVYDMEKKLYLDKEHIVVERLHRLPIPFLRGCAFNKDMNDLLDRIEQCGEPDGELYEELRTMVKKDASLYERIGASIEHIVQKTIKKLRWNYRLAIPSYFPKRDSMSLLLPLDFIDSGKPQAVLVVQLTEAGNYNAPTILNMRYAYQNARLVSSQEASWLTV